MRALRAAAHAAAAACTSCFSPRPHARCDAAPAAARAAEPCDPAAATATATDEAAAAADEDGALSDDGTVYDDDTASESDWHEFMRLGLFEEEEAPAEMTPLGTLAVLPPELLLSILALLPLDARLRCGALSRAWAALVAEPALYARLRFDGCPSLPARAPRAHALDANALARLCARAGHALRSLDAPNAHACGALTAAGVLAAVQHAPGRASLEELAMMRHGTTLSPSLPRRAHCLHLEGLLALRAACPALCSGWLMVRCEHAAQALPVMQALPPLPRIYIALDASGIGLTGAEGVRALQLGAAPPACRLHELWLSRNALGADGAITLAAALPSLRRLRSLHLGRCAIGDEGAVALAAALARPECMLDLLDLSDNGLGDVGITALALTLPAQALLSVLLLASNLSVTVVGVEALAAALPRCARLAHLTLCVPAGCALDTPALRALADAAASGRVRTALVWHFRLCVTRSQPGDATMLMFLLRDTTAFAKARTHARTMAGLVCMHSLL
jgi:hypothetical protein